jgi:hypothetical protein
MATDGTNGVTQVPVSGATKLRRMIESPDGFVAAPGVHDGLSARTTLEVGGWDCLYMVKLALNLPLLVIHSSYNDILTWEYRLARVRQHLASAPQTWASQP